MPGITGFILKHRVGNEVETLGRMIRKMCHEPFYVSSTWVNDAAGLYIGSVAIKGSFSDCMPVYNEKQDLILFLAGECYLDQSVLDGLTLRGHAFDAENASVLVHLYEEKGSAFWKGLNGWFSGMLIDTRQKKAFLFNDRYGMQRIYYHEAPEAFYFSSEAKSLLEVLPGLKRMNPRTVGDYLLLDCAIESRTYFEGVHLLPPGSVWTWSKSGVSKDRYFDIRDLEHQPKLGRQEYFNALDDTVKRILPRYFRGGPIGLALTGGLDSRMILAYRKPAAGEMPCFTFGGADRDTVDVRIARRVAEACRQSHQVIPIDDEFLSDYPAQLRKSIFVTDGLTRIVNSSEVYFNSKVRERVPIKMTGKFASQVVRGLNVLKAVNPNPELISGDIRSEIAGSAERFREIRRGNSLSFLLTYEVPWYFSGATVSEYSQLTVRSPFLDNDFIELLYRAPDEPIDFAALQVDAVSRNAPELIRIMTNGGLGGTSPIRDTALKMLYLFLYRADTLLVQPNLPHSLHHWVARLDFFQISRWFMGFDKYLFYRVWFQKELAGFVREVLLDGKTLKRPYWNGRHIEKIVSDHMAGRGNYMLDISKVLVLEMIHREFID